VVHQAVLGPLLIFGAGLAVIAIRVYAQSSTWQKLSPDLNVFWFHQLNQVFHDDVDAIFVKSAVVAEAEELQLQTFAFNQFLIRNITHVNSSKIGLSGNGAQAGKFRAIEFHPGVVLRMSVVKAFQHFGAVVEQVFALVSEVF